MSTRIRTFFGIIFLVLLLQSVSPTLAAGVAYDLTTTSNFNLRIDGPIAGTSGIGISYFIGIETADLDSNGKKDLIVTSGWSDNNSRSNSGSIYVIFDSLLQKTGTGNTLDLSNSASYSIRYDGAATEERLGFDSIGEAKDVNGDGLPDLILQAKRADYNSRTDSGSVYVIYSTLVDDYVGTTGNNVDLATTSNWNLRLDGPDASHYATSLCADSKARKNAAV